MPSAVEDRPAPAGPPRAARRLGSAIGALAGAVLASGCGFFEDDMIPDDLPSDATNILLLHHSVGENVWKGGVGDYLDAYNGGHDTDYNMLERWFPHEPYPDNENDPYDYWKIWVDSSGDDTYEDQETLEHLTAAYDVIVWKNCYFASDLEADAAVADVSSPQKTVANHKLQFLALREKMREFPDTKFVVWTVPPKTEGETTPEIARRAEQVVSWQRDKWDQPGDNVFLWDFQALATDGGLYLTDDHAVAPMDSHPNEEFSKDVAPLLGRRIVDVIEGRGDEASLTGG